MAWWIYAIIAGAVLDGISYLMFQASWALDICALVFSVGLMLIIVGLVRARVLFQRMLYDE